MLAKFFSIGNRNYLNNAVVISDALEVITKIFGDVKNFRIQFRKPFLSQGDFRLSTEKLDGHVIGQFETNNITFYFSYIPTDIPMENRDVTGNDIKKEINLFNVCYYMTDMCRGVIEHGFEKAFGPMTPNDKVIFVVFEVPDTSVITDVVRNHVMPIVRITEAKQTMGRRFVVSVYFDDKLLGHRHSTVKEFIV